MTDKKTFGAFIKAKRTEKNYSQKELADMLFVTEGAISKWERGKNYPDIELLPIIADFSAPPSTIYCDNKHLTTQKGPGQPAGAFPIRLCYPVRITARSERTDHPGAAGAHNEP